MTHQREIQAVKRIIEQEVHEPMQPGTVISTLPTGAKVRITGSNIVVEAGLLRGTTVRVGDNVVLFRLKGQYKWSILGVSLNQNNSGASTPNYDRVLAPPLNFRVYNGWGFVIAMWDVPVQRSDLSFQVQSALDTEAVEGAEFHTVSGHNFISVLEPGETRRYRARCLNEAGEYSGWTDWITGTSQTIYFDGGVEENMPPASEAHDNQPYFAYDTKTLYVAHNGAWMAVAGQGASSNEPGYWDVDLAPSTPGAHDNEFDGALTDFVEYDPTGKLTASTLGGYLYLNVANGDIINIPGLWKELPDADWTVTTKVRVEPFDASGLTALQIGAGLMVRSEAPEDDSLPSDMVDLTIVNSPAQKMVFMHGGYGPDWSGRGGQSYVNTSAKMSDDTWVYFRIRQKAVTGGYNVWLEASHDGEVWESKQVLYTVRQRHVGLCVWSWLPTADETLVKGIFEFFRYQAECVEPDEPVSGRFVGEALTERANMVADVVQFTWQTASPLALGAVAEGDHFHACKIIVDTPFDGTVSMNVGEPGATSRLIESAQIDPYEAGQYVNTPEYTYPGETTINLYLSKSGCSQGAGRVILVRKE